ncbi:hypothetical protein [Pseudoduganella namucuonensis]|uniref:Uncharacterized protein n=1 Tax=Pseudoduganella namucuonensis TaxID=1035707 RepID=A0A1I7LH03_9BURK|nr:hypothetical protein [Pseudoduganella namucuonensis]SFV08957.1 hypothetical protein SAMN05216552_10291 [Pseudoduganella namucuonensis]
MNTTTKPSKEQLRQFMRQRRQAAEPPPSMAEIRRQLGWYLLPPGVRQAR